MKKTFILLSVVLSTCLITSCGKWEPYHRYFINGYVLPHRMFYEIEDDTHVGVFLEGYSIGEKDKQFEALAESNNDNFKHKGEIDFPPRVAFAEPIHSLKVVTLMDFDSQHPAGSDISDLIQCSYESYYKYVQSGFTTSWPEIISCKATEINASNTKLMATYLWLSFLQKPLAPGIYVFDLIFTFETMEVKGRMPYEFK